MEEEGIEQEIQLQPEMAIVGAVYSVNGKTGHVVLTTSDLENTSDYQTGEQVEQALNTKQDTLTAGNNIQISAENVISATDTTYSAGNGLNLSSSNEFSVNTTVVATQNDLSNEVTNRENADIALQQQIDGISASSDVVDIVGTYQDLQNYDTSKLKDNDIIKVLQDSTQNNATTYYRWSTHTDTFTLIGQEGPYYTKAAADAQFVPQTRTINSKALSANITLTASDVSALGTSDIVQTTGSSTSQVMSQNAVTTELNKKLNITDYVVDTELADSSNPVQNRVLNDLLGNMPSDFFNGTATSSNSGTDLEFVDGINIDSVQLNGDTAQQTYTGKNKINLVNHTNHGVTGTVNSDGTVTISGLCDATDGAAIFTSNQTLKAGTYTMSISTTLPFLLNLVVASGINFRIEAGSTSATATLDADYTFGTLYMSMVSGTTYNSTFKIQLVEGSTADYTFEPYVGGIPSPNPDYPQDVQVVTGKQTATINGSKNLFDADYYKNATYSIDSYKYTQTNFLGGRTYTFTAELKSGKSAISGLYVFITTSTNPNSAPIDQRLAAIFNGQTTMSGAWTNTATIPEGSTLYFQLYPTTADLEQVFDTYNFMLEYGTTASPYEPFAGYANYNVDLTSKNLFDKNNPNTLDGNFDSYDPVIKSNDYHASIYIPCKPNTTYTIQMVSDYDRYIGYTSVVPAVGDTVSGVGKMTTQGDLKVATITTNATAKYLVARVYHSTQDAPKTFDEMISTIQIEENSSATAYEPYYNYELCKIGTYQDYIYKSGDDWYVHKETRKITLTGTGTWSVSSRLNGYQFARSIAGQKIGVDTQVEYFCDNFYGIKFNDRDTHNESIYSYSGDNFVRILTNVASTEAGFQTWLSTHNTTVYYILATATDTLITNSTLIGQLNALANAPLFSGANYIEISANDNNLPSPLDITVVNANAQGIIYKLRNS